MYTHSVQPMGTTSNNPPRFMGTWAYKIPSNSKDTKMNYNEWLKKVRQKSKGFAKVDPIIKQHESKIEKELLKTTHIDFSPFFNEGPKHWRSNPKQHISRFIPFADITFLSPAKDLIYQFSIFRGFHQRLDKFVLEVIEVSKKLEKWERKEGNYDPPPDVSMQSTIVSDKAVIESWIKERETATNTPLSLVSEIPPLYYKDR